MRALRFGAGLAGSVHSGVSGTPLYLLTVNAGPVLFGDAVFAVTDENGDDIAAALRQSTGTFIETRSASMNATLSLLLVAVAQQPTRNGEPFLSVTDVDGDGHRDALGGRSL